MQHWYVAYVRSRSEKVVEARLTKKGFTCYLPLMKTVRQWSDRKKTVAVPLFNGYLFVKCSDQQLTDIRMIPGVVNFIYQESKPAIIPEKQILDIKQFLETGLTMEAQPDTFAPGEKVRINFGPMTGTIGELIAIENEKQFLLRIEVIKQALLIKIPAAHIEKLS